MGYPPGVKAWHCCDKETGTFFNLRDVIFLLQPFPDDLSDDDDAPEVSCHSNAAVCLVADNKRLACQLDVRLARMRRVPPPDCADHATAAPLVPIAANPTHRPPFLTIH
jgi:hypothetical protein